MVEDEKDEAVAEATVTLTVTPTPTQHDEEEEEEYQPYQPSVTLPLLFYWILPVLILAIVSRFAIYDGPAVKPPPPSKPVTLNYDDIMRQENKMKAPPVPVPLPPPTPEKSSSSPSSMPTMLSSKPSSYQEVRVDVLFVSHARIDNIVCISICILLCDSDSFSVRSFRV